MLVYCHMKVCISSHHDMDSMDVVTDKTVKMCPGQEEIHILKAEIPDDLWDSLYKMAEKGKIFVFLLS